jgi:hypothetical protein
MGLRFKLLSAPILLHFAAVQRIKTAITMLARAGGDLRLAQEIPGALKSFSAHSRDS